MTIFYFWEN